MTTSNTREVQVVATRADVGQVITQGFFRLSLNYAGLTDIDAELHTQTELIPFNATIDQMKAALEAISTIEILEVRREGPWLPQNTYEWKITHDWGVPRRGDLPLLVVSHEEQFDVTWHGSSNQVVWVRELRRGTVGSTFCTLHCEHLVANLAPGLQYTFRVRAHSASGWGAWSGESAIVTMPSLAPPGSPAAPLPQSAGPDFVSLSLVRACIGLSARAARTPSHPLRHAALPALCVVILVVSGHRAVPSQVAPARRDGGLRKDIRMETQYQIVSDPALASLSAGNLAGAGVWTAVPVAGVGATNSISITVAGLKPATAYQFRCGSLCAEDGICSCFWCLCVLGDTRGSPSVCFFCVVHAVSAREHWSPSVRGLGPPCPASFLPRRLRRRHRLCSPSGFQTCRFQVWP